ncbi:unnamed protein product [Strongylus vulgaris]|uniref:Uncharacterized protein n=1 Tax=Strongylus vulgaris TaxID=40348 RepID=A0A3P7J855_STRVU|nr:unnamed protein product [Strongylus vulgaris]
MGRIRARSAAIAVVDRATIILSSLCRRRLRLLYASRTDRHVRHVISKAMWFLLLKSLLLLNLLGEIAGECKF